MLEKLLFIIKEVFDLDELYIVENISEREGFYSLPLHDTHLFLQVPRQLSNKSVFNIKQLVEIMLDCDKERLYNKHKDVVLEDTFQKTFSISDRSVTLRDIISDSFSFAGEDVDTAIFLDEDLISNNRIDDNVLLISQEKLRATTEFETFLGDGEHLGYGTEHIRLIVISKKRIDPFIKWAFKMKLSWLNRIYSGNLAYQEKIRAEEQTRLKDKFVSMVSHDLRSPLSGVLVVLRMLQSDQANPLNQSQQKVLKMAIKTSHQLIEMIGTLLNTSRFQTGELVLTPTLIPARNMVDTVLEEFCSLEEKKKVQLVNDIPENFSTFGDYDLVCIVLRNLISNAIKFCNAGDSVTISCSSVDSISVVDTGTGINPDVVSNLFTREIKTSSPGTDGEGGTGLGLPLCYDIIKAHEGDLTVESSSGEGSIFTITLPLGAKLKGSVTNDNYLHL